MIGLFTLCQIICFQLCAVPGMVRIYRRKSSQDLSIWREILILVGVSFQIGAYLAAGVPWTIFAGPITSAVSVGAMLGIILYYRGR